MQLEKDYIKNENKKLMEIRNEIFEFLDKNLPHNEDGSFDFKSNPKLDAKEVYERFFKLDYQARKLRALLVQTYDLKAE